MADVILPTQEQLSALRATQYQIAFVTSDTMDGTSGSESSYNTIAATDAAENHTLNNLGASWTAITTTTTMDASVNATTYSGVPIFNTQGQLILSDGSQLYTNWTTYSLANPIEYDESGSYQDTRVWTGGYANNGDYQQYPLGDPHGIGTVVAGDDTSTTVWNMNHWISPITQYPVYALSSPVPEPTTLTLLVSALLGPGLVYLRRRGAKA
jgi:hypothetical protein